MERIAEAARAMLTQRFLPFWKALRDEENGGFYGYVDFGPHVDCRVEKGSILWFFSQAALTLGGDSLVPYTRHAYRFLRERCLDREQGGSTGPCTSTASPVTTASTPTAKLSPSTASAPTTA